MKVIILILLILFSTAASAAAVAVNPGDILIYCRQEDRSAAADLYIRFFERMGVETNIYAPILSPSFPMMKSWGEEKGVLCVHAIVATKDSYDVSPGWNIVVLKPTPEFSNIADLSAMVGRARTMEEGYNYNQPFLRLLRRWIPSPMKEKWFGGDPPPPKPENILLPEFWERDFDCSGLVAWLAVEAWVKGSGGTTGADWIQDHPEFGMALDMITPGQLAWWLVKTGIYEEEKSPLLIKK